MAAKLPFYEHSIWKQHVNECKERERDESAPERDRDRDKHPLWQQSSKRLHNSDPHVINIIISLTCNMTIQTTSVTATLVVLTLHSPVRSTGSVHSAPQHRDTRQRISDENKIILTSFQFKVFLHLTARSSRFSSVLQSKTVSWAERLPGTTHAGMESADEQVF